MDIATRPDLIPLLAPPELPSQNLTKPHSSKQEARQAAEKFEAFFLRTVLEDIIPAPKEDAFGGGGNAEKIWSSMLHEHYAEMLAKRGGVGIADIVYQQLLTLQEASQESAQESPEGATQETPAGAQETPSKELSSQPLSSQPLSSEEQAR